LICSLQTTLATFGIETQTPQQIEPIQIWPPSLLVQVTFLTYPSDCDPKVASILDGQHFDWTIDRDGFYVRNVFGGKWNKVCLTLSVSGERNKLRVV